MAGAGGGRGVVTKWPRFLWGGDRPHNTPKTVRSLGWGIAVSPICGIGE